uniref:T-cell receptor alpha/delta variable 22.0 n=1 Tax=Scleropages formosus TaxID=113540 RepID=A0A8C9WB25_SCLFO
VRWVFNLLFTAISAGDEIQQKESSLLKEEGQSVSLECTFSTTSTGYWIHWYRQYPGTAPQFILFSGSNSYSAEFAKERFSSNADKASGEASLSISRVQLEDSAVYYCFCGVATW